MFTDNFISVGWNLMPQLSDEGLLRLIHLNIFMQNNRQRGACSRRRDGQRRVTGFEFAIPMNCPSFADQCT